MTLVTTALAEVESFSLCESADGFARAKSDTIGSEFARHTLRALLAVETGPPGGRVVSGCGSLRRICTSDFVGGPPSLRPRRGGLFRDLRIAN